MKKKVGIGFFLSLVSLLSLPAPGEPAHAPEVFRVRFETSQGVFVVEAHREWAPRGVDRFHELVEIGRAHV